MLPLTAVVAILELAASSFAADADPIVKVAFGETTVSYRGKTAASIEHFQNIKYGHDTSGSRRFAPPTPYIPDSGEIDATLPGPACAQMRDAVPPFFSETPDISEDCLNLRITRPAGTKEGDKLPVVVWVAGGGVVKGNANDPHFDPEKLLTLGVEIGKPVIWVSFEYRLTIFGFARLPSLKEDGSLNNGMRDQREAMQWVKDHVEAFGGDPERITAYGLSAGGTMTSLQLVSYGGEKGVPFTQAWVMSGPPGTAVNMSSEATETHTRACLRDVLMEDLLSTAVDYSKQNFPPAGLFTFIPSVDGDYFPDRQSVLYKAGRFVKGIPMVFGWTQDDGATNAGPAHLITVEEDMIAPIARFAPLLEPSDFTELFSHYPAADFKVDVANYEARKEDTDPSVSVHFFRVARIMRDLFFTCSSIDLAFEMTRQTRLEKKDWNGVRLYDLNQTMLTPLLKMGGMPYAGAIHGSDSNYIFNGHFLELPVEEKDKKLSREFSTAFINFAYIGNPNSGGAPEEEWVPAFGDMMNSEPSDEPQEISIEVIGGPYGSGPITLKSDLSVAQEVETLEQQVMNDGTEYAAMHSPTLQIKRAQLEKEKLFERCAYINTLAEKLGH
ncbi:uncharacterized protein N0V89_003205 [Didymosphaeria variabile]|uniref:Carboxylesterase type B domain-containing protein n=1 Tax=Didymosphaeria variabile TaxID=1932322 RepID=A0A9W8XTJ5_9PLEO|nr:uncharacterized protein N0V89_003205 [Didymosphaeria variabile]KAJ4358621.1 hypothetical protein N0V89_003205 [Didymosphaeria variabile]